MTWQGVPKADMHVHLEGTMTPDLMCRIAARNGRPVPDGLVGAAGAHFTWVDDGTAASALRSFVAAYDAAASVIATPEDYADIAFEYLTRAGTEKCIYAEIFISPDHAAASGVGYPAMCVALASALDAARETCGIEARLISTCVRHYGSLRMMQAAQATASHPHPLVTGMGVAGDENAGTFSDVTPAFAASGLPFRTAHAGEAAGPDSVRDAFEALGVRRFGHMVRAAEDPDLLARLLAAGAVPEVCVSSNLALKVFVDAAHHPLRRLFDMGFRVVLGSDDPAFFGTSIGREYALAQDAFGFSDAELLCLTRNAIDAAFVDESTRARLLARL